MHYIGMAAMRLSATMHYNLWMVALSVIIAMVVSSVALWIAFNLRVEEKGSRWIRAASAVVMGFAIASMHYTGMAAVCFRETGILCDQSDAVSISALGATGIALLALLVLGVALVTGAVNRRFALQERALALREQENRLFFEDNIAAVCRATIHGRILAVNSLFVAQLGYDNEEEALGTNFWDQYPNASEKTEVYDELLRNQKVRGRQMQFRDKQGNHRWKLVNCALLASAVPPEIIVTSMDISDLKKVQEELLQAKEKAEAAAVSKSQFLANMSHELRTPLNAILGLTDLVLEGPLTAEHRDFLEIVKNSGENLLKIINDVLDFSKIEANRLVLHREAFSLRQLVEETVDCLSVTLRGRSVRLYSAFPASMPQAFSGDAFRLRQVLMNLVGNAIKFTQAGEIAVRVDEVTVLPDGFNVRLSVRDTGIGIPAHKLNSIFESFTQAESATTQKFGGTGLGLAIARELVAAMGGSIRVESVEGQGSAFCFDIVLGTVASPLPEMHGGVAEQEPAEILA
jgi:PAS domain S-box-containing protein